MGDLFFLQNNKFLFVLVSTIFVVIARAACRPWQSPMYCYLVPPVGVSCLPAAVLSCPAEESTQRRGSGRVCVACSRKPSHLPKVLLRCPIKSSGLRIPSILSTSATRSGRCICHRQRSLRSPLQARFFVFAVLHFPALAERCS